MREMHWMLDGRIDLTAIAEREQWHLGSTIRAIAEAAALTYQQAEPFALFLLTDYALAQGGRADCNPDEYLPDGERERLSLAPIPEAPREPKGAHTMHDLVNRLTSRLQERGALRAETGGPAGIEFAFRRAEQQWLRVQIPAMAADVAAGVAAHHGLTVQEAQEFRRAIEEVLERVAGDESAGREWLRAMYGYAIAAAEAVGAGEDLPDRAGQAGLAEKIDTALAMIEAQQPEKAAALLASIAGNRLGQEPSMEIPTVEAAVMDWIIVAHQSLTGRAQPCPAPVALRSALALLQYP